MHPQIAASSVGNFQRVPSGYEPVEGVSIGGDSRQPDIDYSTQVIASIKLVCVLGDEHEVTIEVSGDDNAWIVIAIISAEITTDVATTTPVVFEIPPAWYYRFTETGSGSASIENLVEQLI